MSFRSRAPLSLALVAACSTSSGTAPSTNGVDDVLKACQIRAPWQNASSSVCNDCIAFAITPRCSCTDRDYAGKCEEQQAARTAEPSCDGTDACIGKCNRIDCNCLDTCYANSPLCRKVASAVDGCVAEVCDSSCR